MLWRVLKPDLGLADEPSVPDQIRCRTLIQVAVFTFTSCCSPLLSSAASPAAGSNGPEAAEIATVEYLPDPLVPEPDRQTLKVPSPVVPEYTIRRTAPEVRLQFSVADERGHLITDLAAKEIRILDDHFAVERIRQFSRAEDLPLDVGLLLDVSDSVRGTIAQERGAIQLFLSRVMHPSSDRAFLMAFGRDIQLWQSFTGDTRALSEGLQRTPKAEYATNLYDSVFYACLNYYPRVEAEAQAQRIILLLSDGDDTASLHTMAEAIAVAERREIQIYAVSIHPGRKFATGDAILRRMAEETGGQAYVASKEKDFPVILTDMERQMRTQYYVSFPPERQTPGFHDLRVEATSNRNLHVHARQGYYIDAP